jgi:hypothetical protein
MMFSSASWRVSATNGHVAFALRHPAREAALAHLSGLVP